MSSTIKRVALVAVAALSLGGVTAITASATPVTAAATPCYASTSAYTSISGSDTATASISVSQVAGAANYIELTCGSDLASSTYGVLNVSGASATITSITDGTTDAKWVVASDKLSAATSDTNMNAIASGVIRIATPVAGTATVTVSKRTFSSGSATDTVLQTFTVTVTAAGVAGVAVASTSTSLLDKDATAAGSYTAPDADETAVAAKAAGTANGVAKLTIKDANSVLIPNPSSANVTATVSGVGTVSLNSSLSGATYATSGRAVTGSTSSGVIYAAFYGDGNSGTSTVTFSVGTTVISTETVTYYGSVATLTGTAKILSIAPGATTSGVIEVVAKDANGNVVPNVTITGTASNTTAITAVTAAGDGDLDGDQLVGFTTASTAAGNYTVTFSDGTVTSSAVTFTVGKTTAKTVTFSTDKDEYAPGELVTITVKALDSNGNPVADGSRALLAADATSSVALQGTLPAATPTIAGGVKTYTVYAPLVAGDVIVKSTEGAATDNVGAGGTAATISVTIKVVEPNGGTSAAIDAANEATDAANAATDAANAAAEAADAATAAAQDAQAAVAALATQVASLIAGIKAQITTLTNLVIKIQKKVKA